MSAFIKGISYYLPEKTLTNADLATLFPEWSVEKTAKKIGIEQRHIAAEDEFASDMAIAAANKLFTEYNISPTEIDFILYCTQSPDYFLPSTSCIIQDKLAIPVTAGAIDFNLGSSGYIYGLAIAKGLIAAGIAKNILLLTSDTYSKLIHEKDRGNRTVFGDAATASLISNNGFAQIGEFELGTDGKGAENLMVKQGAMRFPKTDADPVIDENGNNRYPQNLYMNGIEIFSFTSKEVPGLVAATLKKNKLTKADIKQFIFHQANQQMLEHLRKKIDIDPDKFYTDMINVGNTVSSTVPIALYEAMKSCDKNDANWLLAGFGVGYSWAATVITFD